MITPHLALFILFSALTAASARKITVTNLCPSTVWPALLSPQNLGTPIPSHPTGWELPSGDSTSFEVADNWTAGRIWARTGCVLQDGKLRCLTGQCGEPKGKEGQGSLECYAGGEAPATLAEFTLAPEGADHYDMSLVDGFNVPMIILPSADCPKPDCPVNINEKCPEVLRSGLDQNGANLGCSHSCIMGFGQEKFGNRACCSGGYNDPTLCAICGVDFYNVFKENCPNAYASETALFTCPSSAKSDYEIVFCPGGTDYVGPQSASTEYANDFATCENKVTSGKQEFTVKPSPTTGQAIGDIKYTARPGKNGGGVAVSSVSRPQAVPSVSRAHAVPSVSRAPGVSSVSKAAEATSVKAPALTSASRAAHGASKTAAVASAAAVPGLIKQQPGSCNRGGAGKGRHRHGRPTQ